MLDEIKQKRKNGFYVDNPNASDVNEDIDYLIGEVERLEKENEQHYRSSNYWNHEHSKATERGDKLQKALKQWEDFANHLNKITSCSMTKNEIRQALNTFARKEGNTP